MTSRLILLTLAFAASACGGATVGIGPGIPDDAGGHPPDQGDGGTPPVGVDAGGPTSHDAASGPSCMKDVDCTGGQKCAWPTSEDTCDSLLPVSGTCVTPLDEPCGAEELVTGCGCGDHDVQWTTGCVGLPQGWAPVGLQHAGPCAGGGPGADAGPTMGDSGSTTSCETSADCAPGLQCGFGLHAGCGAVGQCLPMSDFPLCNCIGAPYCGCDGTDLDVSCCTTYVNQPVQHEGACGGEDGGF
jgi:hypothetical protein